MSTPLTAAGGSGSPPPGARRHLGVGALVTIVLLALLGLLGACDGGSVGSEDAPTAAEEPGASGAEHDRSGAGPDRSGEPVAGIVPALHPAVDGLDEAVVTITSDGAEHEVVAKVAATGEERARGLMEVPSVPDGVGMLFLFEQERTGGFWMWNTFIALDIAFIGADGVAHTLATMVPCEAERSSDCPTTSPPEPYRVALEVPGGWFEQVGIEPGARVTWSEPRPVVP